MAYFRTCKNGWSVDSFRKKEVITEDAEEKFLKMEPDPVLVSD